MGGKLNLVVTEEQRQELLTLAKSAKRGEADRARAILHSLEGATSPEISRALHVRADHARHWIQAFRYGGVERLRSRPRPGRPPVVANLALPVVRDILSAPVPPGVVWTVPRLAEEVGRRTGRKPSSSYLSVVMRKKGICAGDGQGTR